MTGPERLSLDELNVAFAAMTSELAALREAVKPAIHLANALARVADALADMGRFLKWGTGIGASVVSIAAGGRLLGLW